MQLRVALNEYKQRRGHVRFPEERRTTHGAFSGASDRLVFVDPSGAVRDYGYPLSGLEGIERSRLGLATEHGFTWFDELETIRQHYYGDTMVVETELDAGTYTVHQFDLTIGRTHLTHVELRGEIPPEPRLAGALTFSPEGREAQTGQLIHPDPDPPDDDADRAPLDVAEVFHDSEHDYVTASTGLATAGGQVPEAFADVVSDAPVPFPRDARFERFEDAYLSGSVLVTAPLEQEGRHANATLVTRLADHDGTDRETVLSELRETARTFGTADDIRDAGRDQIDVRVPDKRPLSNVTAADVRALQLLRSPQGAHLAGPDFDPFFQYSGGYGYTWFRDDAEIARYLLETSRDLSLALDGHLADTARFYLDTQLADGTWPHRVWPKDGALAPGWANSRLVGRGDAENQCDQTASVVSFLATYLRERDPGDALAGEIEAALADAYSGLEAMLDDDGVPRRCQNCWENMTGQFSHTAATFLEAFSALARAPVDEVLSARARERADEVYDAIDAFWSDKRAAYGLRLDDGDLDKRLDASSFALVAAHAEYDAVSGVDDDRLDRLLDHVRTLLDGLYREPDSGQGLAGLIRFEGDTWRTDDQSAPKLWSVSTGWGASAAAELATLVEDDVAEDLLGEAAELFELLLPDGPFTTETGFLAEQVFDDGTPDSAAPLGWSHALRLRVTGQLKTQNALPATRETRPKGPASDPAWTTAEKYGVGTVQDHGTDNPSKVWFTMTKGALTEVRFPQIDLMNIRTFDFLVVDADPDSDYTARTYNEERSDDDAETIERRAEIIEEESLAFRQTITETGDGQGHEWSLTVEYATDPVHDAVLADFEFAARDDNEYDVFAVGDVALTNSGVADRGYQLGSQDSYHLAARDAGRYDALVNEEGGLPYSVATAIATADRFDWATVGVAGHGHLTELFADGTVPESHEQVDDENVVLVGRCASGVTAAADTVAVGFAREADTAAALGEAEGALARGFDTVRTEYDATWSTYLSTKPVPDAVADDEDLLAQYKTALMVIKAVEDKTYEGACIASPSVPWGNVVGAVEPRGYGYNFVWSRDLYQSFTVFDAVDDLDTAKAALEYVYEYQQDDHGFIPQNTYLDGRTRWGGEQMDNISFPQVMAYHLFEGGYDFDDLGFDYDNVRKSADYVVRNGPYTEQERWEEEAGYSPSSIAAEIAGLGCAAKVAAHAGEVGDALVYLSLADAWTTAIETLCVTYEGTDRHDRTPYYMRISANGDPDSGMARSLANNGPTLDERDVIDAGFLELVRLGIKPADDEIIQNSVAVVDETIRVDTPAGPAFYRYNGDGYGELMTGDEGAPWAIHAQGKGRLWPIFTGERGEYELYNGTETGPLAPENLLRTMERFANSGRMLPEQVWDEEHETDYNWEIAEGTGAATPLAWSMAQFVRLAHGVDSGTPVETPAVLAERYGDTGHPPDGPDLTIDTPANVEARAAEHATDGGTVRIAGRTDGALVACKSPAATEVTEVGPDGEFAFEIPVYDHTPVAVAAADSTNPFEGGTNVRRFTL